MIAPTSSAEALIKLTGVDVASARNYSVVVVEGVNWKVNSGEFWVVGAPYASGKSDLLATAAGLQPPLRGRVQLFGRDLAGLKESVLLTLRLRIGMVFKWGGRMFSHLTVAENVALPLRYHHDLSFAEASTSIEPIMELAGLSPFLHNTSGMLPPHLRQRVGLARALVLKPELLFLDDPFTGLEQRERAWWLDFLQQLSIGSPALDSRRMTLVLTTNEIAPWAGPAQRFAALKEKRFIPLADSTEFNRALTQQ